jgi:hypothetical protein
MASSNSKVDAIGDNKIDVSNSLWNDQRDKDQGGTGGVVALDGAPAPRPGFEGQGSDAGNRKGAGARHVTKLPPTVG